MGYLGTRAAVRDTASATYWFFAISVYAMVAVVAIAGLVIYGVVRLALFVRRRVIAHRAMSQVPQALEVVEPSNTL